MKLMRLQMQTLAVVAGMGLLGIVLLPVVFGGTRSNRRPPATNVCTPAPVAEKEITIGAVGDCVLGTDDRFIPRLSFNYYRHELHKPDSYFFSGVKGALSQDDLTVANAECVIAAYDTRVHKPKQKGGRFWFRGDPDNAGIFKAGGVEAVNLANNHSDDYGPEGFNETVANLQHYGVTPFGCGIRQVVVRKGVRIGLLGYCVMGPLEQGTDENVLKAQIAGDLAYMRAHADLSIVTFHWGIEEMHTVTPQQVRLGHFAVDHGANLIIGGHPHVLEPIETYKGVSILYSLGNFVYGGSASVKDRDTIIYQRTFCFTANNHLVGQSEHVVPCLIYAGALNDYRPVLASSIRQTVFGDMVSRIPADFVQVSSYIPNVVVDLRYATPDNPYKHRFYDKPTCYLQRPVADRMRIAAGLAASDGYRIKIWDAYRPYSVQQELKKYVPDPQWIAQGISNHNRGAAVDITLVEPNGQEIDMGTGFDTFTPLAHYKARGLTIEQIKSRGVLRSIMMKAGFHPISTEWWHFDAPNCKRYSPVDAAI